MENSSKLLNIDLRIVPIFMDFFKCDIVCPVIAEYNTQK